MDVHAVPNPVAPPQKTEDPDYAWLKALRSQVESSVFDEGRRSAGNRGVVGLVSQADRVAARVVEEGGDLQSVELNFSEGSAESRCSCPAWSAAHHCKHAVAVALVHVARRRQAAAEAARPVSSGPRPEEGALLPAQAKVEGWLGLSSQADCEIVYRLTATRNNAGLRNWVVEARRHDATGKGPIHVKRALSSGLRISPQDEAIFTELARFEGRFDGRLMVTDEELSDLVPLLRHRRVIYRGMPLVFSLEAAQVQVRLESKTAGAAATLGLLLPSRDSLPLSDAIVLPGKRTHALVSQTLFPVEPTFPARLLRKWMLEPTMLFAPGDLDRLLGFFAAHLPRFRMSLQADGIDVEEAVPPQFTVTVEGAPEKAKVSLFARYGSATVPVSPYALHVGYAAGSGPEGSAKKLFRRSSEGEKQAAKWFLARGFAFDSAEGAFVARQDQAIAFWSEGVRELPSEWERLGVQRKPLKIRPRVRPRVRLSMSGVDWFELDADFGTENQSVDLGAVRLWLASGRRYIPLKDGSYAEADRLELERAATLLEEAGALPGKKKSRLPLFQAAALDLLREFGEQAEIDRKAEKKIRELLSAGFTPMPSPHGFVGTLRPYQEAGMGWLWSLHRHALCGILADDMGLGKTIQALSLLLEVKNQEGPRPSLVVAPTSVLTNWQREAERFTPGLTTMVWHGQDRRERAEQLKSVDLVLTSYALVRRDAAELSKVGFRYVILDEAQNIKNADSATAQASKSLPCDLKLALTGTPLENRLSELWSIFDFLMPGFLGDRDDFIDRYESPVEAQGDLAARERLKKKIRPFVLRRLKTEVARDLPPKTETVSYCEMDAEQAALYREVLEHSRSKVFESIGKVGFGRSRVSILAALMRLRQVCCDPRLLKMAPGVPLPPSAKLDRFAELLEDLVSEGHRALVFSQFTEMLALLTQRAEEMKVPYLYLDGRTRDRMAKVDAFNDPKGPPVFFISLKAGGTGLNLTAADYVIHYDPWWNPAVEDQATDRTHRIGQTKAVFSYKLITRGTVEEKILGLQKRKRDLAAGVLGTDGEFGKALSEQDVEFLFRTEDLE